MINTKNRVFALAAAVLLLTSAGVVVADQKIKTKSNIKNDRVAEASVSSASSSESSSANSSAAPVGKNADTAR